MASEKILIRMPSGLKDAIFAEPAVNCVKENFPEAEIWAAASVWTGDLFAGRGFFDGIIKIPTDENLREMKDAILEIRRLKFSAGLILDDSFGSVLLFYASAVPERWGYSREGARLMLTKTVKPAVWNGASRHRVDHFLGLVRGLGFNCSRRSPALEVTEEEKTRATAVLISKGLTQGQRFVILAPGSNQGAAGRWPAERFAEAASMLQAEAGVQVMLAGSDADYMAVSQITGSMTIRPLVYLGLNDLRLYMAVIRASSLVIANDNDTLQMAAALGTPVVAVFGPSDPDMSSPLAEKSTVIYTRAPCSPCQYTECPWDHRCMMDISSGKVFAAVKSLL